MVRDIVPYSPQTSIVGKMLDEENADRILTTEHSPSYHPLSMEAGVMSYSSFPLVGLTPAGFRVRHPAFSLVKLVAERRHPPRP